MHPRTAIRRAMVDAVGQCPVFDGRVTATRRDPLSTPSLPAATILTVDETSDVDTTGARRRDPRFQVTGVALAGDDPDATVDDLAEAIEAAVATNATLRGLCKSLVLLETRFDFRFEDKEGKPLSHPLARIGLIYRATYRTTPAGVAA